MPLQEKRSRKWERYGCLMPCHIMPKELAPMQVGGRIVNIGRGGILMESDYSFNAGDMISIIPLALGDAERFQFKEAIHGTVRWGQLDTSSLMGLFYVGVEFDDLLPLKEAISTRR